MVHADHYNLNAAYSPAVYSKGEVFMEQLGYIVGASVRDKILLEYYNQWRFKHPNAADFIRIAEKVSDMKLDWYKEYWISSTKTIDYSIDSLWEENGVTNVRIKRNGLMPMPIDVQLTFKDGTKEMHYVPLDIISTAKKLFDFTAVEIDPSQRMADVERRNNKLEPKW